MRVVSGDTLEVKLEQHRMGIGLLGIQAPPPKTSCGRQATALLQRLTSGVVSLESDSVRKYDARGRRLFYIQNAQKRSIALSLVQAGVVRTTGQGKERQALAIAQARAKAAHHGCLWVAAGPQSSSPRWASQAEVGLLDQQSATVRAATGLPDGFQQDVVVSSLSAPTAFTFLSDGRILVAEKRGIVRVIKNGRLNESPMIDISDHVSNYWDHGLLGIVADPQFSMNGFIYVKYTFEHDPTDYAGPKTDRVTRLRVVDDIALVASETTILGSQVGPGCGSFPNGTDCLPAEGPSHEGGQLVFGSDGSLLVTTGDASNFTIVDPNALRALDLGVLAGKLLRVSPTGDGLPDNPFFDGDPRSNRSKVWAYGLRNPF